MVVPVEEMRTTVLVPNPTLRLLSKENGASNGRTHGEPNLFKQDVKQATGKVKHSESKQHVFTHGLHHLQHFSCDSPVRFMMYSEAAAAFISLHSDNTVGLYIADGNKQTSLAQLPFMGLTATKIPGALVGWGPGPVFTLLDSELRSMDAAHNALDIRVCQAAEHSTELVTAGEGNVCVWSVRLMWCKVKIQEGLQHKTFTQMALAPPRSDRPHRAFVGCGQVVTLVDLDAGKVLEHKKDLCSRDITAMVYCSQLDCLITASQELSIRIWGPDWELRVAFVGHNGMVNSLYYCSALGMLLSASVDCTIRCWNLEKGDVVECVHTEQTNPALCIGGTKKGDTFFSFSHQGVDVWTFRTLYTLHCKLKEDEGAPLRQILASPFPAPYPTRVLCLSGYSDIMLVAAETGAVLTSFKAEQRILCADYCLQKEILLALTDTGTVLQANTLTNPITLMKEWKRSGQGPWNSTDHVREYDTQNLPIPGPAFCLSLYSYVVETQGALEEWRSLQERRGCSHRNEAALNDAKNRFLIILGQSGGCVSVLKIDNGKVLQRMPAHNGQRVTALQVYPENGYLLSTGEDMTVVVWKVYPYIQECLTQLLSLHGGQSPVYLAALGPKLALTFQEPNSGTYNLRHFNLLNQSETSPPKEGHSDPFTGLCVCPDLEVFVSSSLDGLVCIWNEENQLISTLDLNAVPECLAYSGFGVELFLGIGGDLYRMNCAKFLPHNFQKMLLYTYRAEPLPDMPIIENQKHSCKIKNASPGRDEEKELLAITSRQKQYVSSVTLDMDMDMDLAALLQGSVKCQKGKPPSTKETKKEAFDNYMKIIYGLPLNIKVDLGDTFDPDELEIPYDDKPWNLPTLQKKVHHDAKLKVPVNVEKEKEEKAPTKGSKPQTAIKVKPGPVDKVLTKKPVIVEKYEEPPEILSPIEQPKPPPPRPKTTTPRIQPLPPPPPPPPREPSPEVPMFLQQFVNAGWFKDLYRDHKCIPSTLSPEDFSLQLLGRLNNCSATSKREILAALQELRSQGLLQNTDEFYQGLTDLVPGFVRPHMSPAQRVMLVETLTLLVLLRSASHELVKKLLTLLAFKKLGLRETLLRMLTSLAVNEAEQWLLPELESWDSELQDPRDIWKSLHDKADSWLELWISKYKEHNRLLYLKNTAKWKPSTFSMVDVLNYFCCVQKEEYKKARYVAPAGPKRTVLLPLSDCSSKPILRLGETYSMARVRRPPGLMLPPLRNRPSLMHFPNFISLPISRVTLRPFHIYSDKDWVKASPRRYFIPEQSYVEYYR